MLRKSIKILKPTTPRCNMGQQQSHAPLLYITVYLIKMKSGCPNIGIPISLLLPTFYSYIFMLKGRLHLAFELFQENSRLADLYFEISFKARDVMLHRFADRIIVDWRRLENIRLLLSMQRT